jgi:hypothetical protein
MSMTPFEIRLELLKMAKDMLTDQYYGQREVVSNSWQTQIETARLKGETPPAHPGFPDFPNESEIIKKATELNNFVSQIPNTPLEKTSKKST